MDTISNGWPEDKNQVHACVLPYFPFRDELTVQDGIIQRGERVVIPHSLRLDMKMKVHSGHPGINASLRRARERIYWPGMSKDIRNYVETCDTCATYGTKQAAQALQMHEVPSRPWEKVGADLFSFKGRQYLITVDYYSQFFELDHLPETTSREVIYKLKHHFSRYGIPDTLISDNGPQFSSADLKNFARTWSFKHDPISPGNSKANGAAEASVKIAKSTMMKCQRSKEDPFLAFLNMRNTPTEDTTTSPVQRLIGRRTKTLLPTTATALKPSRINPEREELEKKKFKTSQKFSRGTHLPRLAIGDNVRMQPIDGSREWKQATVTKILRRNSYQVSVGQRSYRRTREFLRSKPLSRCESPSLQHSSSHSNTVNSSPQPLPTIVNSSPPPLPVPTMPPIEPLCSPTPNQVVYEHTPDCEDIAPFPQEHQSTQSTQYTTRSGRTIKKPNKYTE